MSVSVIYAGLRKSYRGSIEVPANCELTLLEFLAIYLPEQVEDLIEEQQITPGYAILIDGRNATQIGELNAIIHDGATVLITIHSVGG